MSIGFWEKESGHMFSYGKGLSEEQIAELRQLKVGDRLVLFKNIQQKENSPHYSLKKSVPKSEIKAASQGEQNASEK